MNNLWIFGDSFSSIIDFNKLNNENVKNYLLIKDLIFYETWSERLSKKMSLNLKNYALGGKSNYQIFFDFCDNSENIGTNDVVIIGWALIGKFIIVNNHKFVDIHPHGNYHHYNMKNETIQEIINNRNEKAWSLEVIKWQKIIETIAREKKFKVIFWSGEETTLKNKHVDLDSCETLLSETNGVIHDTHLGESGHKKLSEIFYSLIYE